MTNDINNNGYCRKCDNCGLPLNDVFISRCPRCNTLLKSLNHSCDSCTSRGSCGIKTDFESKIVAAK